MKITIEVRNSQEVRRIIKDLKDMTQEVEIKVCSKNSLKSEPYSIVPLPNSNKKKLSLIYKIKESLNYNS